MINPNTPNEIAEGYEQRMSALQKELAEAQYVAAMLNRLCEFNEKTTAELIGQRNALSIVNSKLVDIIGLFKEKHRFNVAKFSSSEVHAICFAALSLAKSSSDAEEFVKQLKADVWEEAALVADKHDNGRHSSLADLIAEVLRAKAQEPKTN